MSETNGKWPLPEGWVWTTLGEVATINQRDPNIRNQPDDLDVTFLPMAAVDEILGRIASPQVRKIGEVRKGFTSFVDGDVLFAKITPSMENGKAAIATGLHNGIGFGSTEFHVLRPEEGVLTEWLFYFIRQVSFREDAKANFSGTAGQLRVGKDFLESYSVPLAPLPVQHGIVSEIEKQFTRLDAAVAALRRAKTNLARYKAAVLKAAVEGRLVPQTSEVSETSEVLLARILAERRAQWEAANPKKKYVEPKRPEVAGLPELPVGWVWATVGEVAESLDHMRVPVNKMERQKRLGNIPYYGANGRVGWINDYLFDEPLVLVVEDETFTGRHLPFSYKIMGRAWVNNHAHVLRPRATTVDFLNYSLQFYPFTPLTTGTTGRRKLTQKALLNAHFPMPPLSEQERIVQEVDHLLSVTQVSEQAIYANLARAERLRQGVLGKAFRGELVADDQTSEVF